jgi:transcriptional regulator with XRE-family HTH domain
MRVRRVQEVEIEGLEQALLEAREKSRKSLASICREVGITPVYWYKLVSGKQDSIPEETLNKLGNALDIQFEIVFD